ncbi:MAG: aromatic-ring-hydroxylating dioxygenase subunit beta [Candidatus Binataceae bacterium]|nr:aromatic-ring-hydroxylating dioxygenase subunit beta [Candidatus Binataceae bacterium]
MDNLELLKAVEQFLYSEAEYMDSHQYDRWFELWDEQALYWVPCNADEADPNSNVALIYENRDKIEDRLFRLKGRHAHAQNPRSRLMRVVSNVRIAQADAGKVVVTSQFVLGEVRLDRQTVWIGRSQHTLLQTANGFKIREKKVLLLNNDSPMGNLTFLI